MKHLIFMIITTNLMLSQTIFNFNNDMLSNKWVVTDDVVMGGKSSGKFTVSNEGHGVFEGEVSLENNGGFSSVRYKFKKIKVLNFNSIILKIKGDCKKYQFRIKANSNDYYSYISVFETTNEWQEIQISLNDMYPAFRGKILDKPNFKENFIEEIAFLIGNKKQENFELLIDSIELQ